MGGVLDAPPKRDFSVVIAASNSSAGGADYRCTGTADQTVINAAIQSLGSRGGKILLRQGDYWLTDSITIDRDCVTIEGENRPHWGPGVNQPGTRATALKGANSSAFPMITGQATVTGPTGERRLRGMAFRDLYFYGDVSRAQAGIKFASDHSDVSEIGDCFFHQCGIGIDVAWDTPMIHRNQAQYCNNGIKVAYNYGVVEGNLLYDLNTTGLICEGHGVTISGNVIGTSQPCIVLQNGATGCTVSGNSISGAKVASSGILLDSGSKWNAITGNTVGVHGLIDGQGVVNTTGHGIQIGSTGAACNYNAVTGNTVIAQSTTAGYAIKIANSSTGNGITGNVIGNSSTWNGGSATTIDGGSGNTVANNAGNS